MSFTPPPPPPIDPEYAAKRAEAMRRRAVDGQRYKQFQAEALSTGFLPPPPPSVDYYMANPDYVWNPHEPNPEGYEPFKPEIPPPPPPPPPIDAEAIIAASNRWKADNDRYRKLSGGITNPNKPKSRPPSVTYYQNHPEYVWDPNAPQVS
jgi:hypothetical protein